VRQPNALAWLALYAWPVIVLGVYAVRRSSARPARTTAWMVLLPVMFLPALLKLPFAGLEKHRIAVLSVAAALMAFHWDELRLGDRRHRFPLLVLMVFSLGAFQTLRSNGDPLVFGVLRLPGLGPRDLAWMVYEFFVDMFLPFAIGQRIFRTERDVLDLLDVLSVCVLIYVPLCVLELRLSPQLSNWVYGYFPHSFAQTMRGAGYRPVVFMNHGLSVAMFLFSGLCAALTLRALRVTTRATYTWRSLLSLGILVLSRNLASLLYSGAAILVHLWTSTRTKARLALVLASFAAAYPVLRVSGAFPTADIGAFFRSYSETRADSLMFRFTNEDALLKRAMQRPVFGWGEWGRSRIFASWGESGDEWAGFRDMSVTDSAWIIWLGTFGFVGLAAHLALLVIPLFLFVRSHRTMRPQSQVLAGGLAVMVTLFCIDLLPNSASDFLPLVYSGALFAMSTRVQPGSGTPARRAEPAPSS
jgi:hypothetical protein